MSVNIELLWQALKTFLSCLVKPTNKGELRYTENKFILNKFPSRCNLSFLYKVKNSYFAKRIPLEKDKSFLYSDYEVTLVTAYREGWLER